MSCRQVGANNSLETRQQGSDRQANKAPAPWDSVHACKRLRYPYKPAVTHGGVHHSSHFLLYLFPVPFSSGFDSLLVFPCSRLRLSLSCIVRFALSQYIFKLASIADPNTERAPGQLRHRLPTRPQAGPSLHCERHLDFLSSHTIPL